MERYVVRGTGCRWSHRPQLGPIPQEGKNGDKGDAVTRGWDAVEKVTTLKR